MGRFSRVFEHRIERRTARGKGAQQVPNEFYGRALEALPAETIWAAACNAEFRADGVGDLRGVLHHDGGILRFTTWGRIERFVGSPMEFEWTVADATLHVSHGDRRSWFAGLEPLNTLVERPPAFAAAVGSDPLTDLVTWMETWAPGRPEPTADD